MDFAVIKTGGKQYKVSVGDIIKVEKLKGKKIEFADLLNNKKVSASILEDKKAKKVHIVKFRPKKNYKRNTGHRQTLSLVKIDKIA